MRLDLKCTVCGADIGYMTEDGKHHFYKGNNRFEPICPNCGCGGDRYVLLKTIGVIFLFVGFLMALEYCVKFLTE